MKTNNLITRWIKLAILIASSFLYGMTAEAAAPSYAPTGLTVTVNLSDKTITLTCKDNFNTDVSYYIIQRQFNEEAWNNAYATATAVSKKITYTDVSLASGTYRYRVVAHNDSGNSPASAIKTATINFPTAPASLTVSPNTTNGTVILNWVDASDNETGFTVERQVNSGTWEQYATLGANATTYLDNNHGNGKLGNGIYNYRVYAFNASGTSNATNEASTEILDSIPSTPTNLHLTTYLQNIILTWVDNSTDENSFQLERRLNDGTFELIGEPAANTTTWTVATIAGGYTYYFRVRAKNALGYSAYSNVVSIYRTSGSVVTPGENVAPVIASLNPINVYEGETISQDIAVTDTNTGDMLTLSATGLPSGASLTPKGSGTWTLNWRPNLQNAGTYPVTLKANDGTVDSTPVVLTLTVNDVSTNLSLANKPEWFTETIAENLISDNLVWNWNAFVHPAGIPFVYEYSLNNGAWTETTATSFTATGLIEGGNQSFRVRVKLLTTPTQIISPDAENADSFGIDNTPPTMLTLTLNEGNLGTASTTLNLSTNAHDSLGYGSGIAFYEVSVDGGAYATFTGTALTLPSVYGKHDIVIRGVDKVGFVSNMVSDEIILARHVSTISGTSTDATQVILKDLRSNLEQTVDVASGAFQFTGVPDGLYGLVLTNNDAMKAYDKRISIHDGLAVELGEITIGTDSGSISGEVASAPTDMPVAAGIDLGMGLFLKVNEAYSSSGSFTINNLASGNYVLKAMPEASTNYLPSVADVSVIASETTTQNLSLTPGNQVTGISKVANVLVQAINSNGKFESVLTDSNGSYSMVLPTGDYQFIIKSEYFCIEPQFITINSNTNLPGIVCDSTNALLSGTLTNTGAVFSAEAGINKVLQVFSGEAATNFMTCFSGEYGSSQTTWSAPVVDSMTADNALFLLSDDMGKGIHSLNQVDAASDSSHNITVNSAGGSIRGTVTLNGAPVVKPQVVLLDSAETVIGVCQGSSAGEYFFKNVKPAADYTMKVVDTQKDISKEVIPLTITVNENRVLDVELAVKLLTVTDYETEVTDGFLNTTVEVTGLDSNSTYEVCAALFSSDWETVGEKWITVTNGQFNMELNVAGFSGSNCHLQVYLFKDKNYIFINPEAKEVRHNINVAYVAKKLSITNYESEVTDGILNATLELGGLDINSSYEVCAVLFGSDWATVGEKWVTVTNGQVNVELDVSGYSGSNCHFLVYLFKDGNHSFSNPEVKEVKYNVNVVYTAKKLSISNYESEVTDGVLNATLELGGLDINSSYEVCTVLFSSDWATVGEKWITVTNGQANIELNVAGFSGSNGHLQVYLFKDGNHSFSNPEAKEVRYNVNVVYTAKKLSITNYESEVTDGVLNATLDLAGLDSNSTYEVCAALFNSSWSTVGEKWITVTNGQTDIELNVAGFSGSNCHLQIYLFKDKNHNFSNPEAKEVRNSVSIS